MRKLLGERHELPVPVLDEAQVGEEPRHHDPLAELAEARLGTFVARERERELGERYLRIRFEDLCRRTVETAERIYGFFGLEGDPEAVAGEVRDRSDATVVAITGSMGKTTTKDILAAIALPQRRTVAA